MKRWTAIKYREFYDIPRILLVEIGSQRVLFDCPFNVVKDEYEETYKVYQMPRFDEKELAGSWESLPGKATRLLGEIPTSEVEFDATLRRRMNLDVLSRFGL